MHRSSHLRIITKYWSFEWEKGQVSCHRLSMEKWTVYRTSYTSHWSSSCYCARSIIHCVSAALYVILMLCVREVPVCVQFTGTWQRSVPTREVQRLLSIRMTNTKHITRNLQEHAKYCCPKWMNEIFNIPVSLQVLNCIHTKDQNNQIATRWTFWLLAKLYFYTLQIWAVAKNSKFPQFIFSHFHDSFLWF